MLDRPGDAARPRRDHRRHRARAVALCRRDHDPHPRPRRRWSSLRAYATVPVINGLTRLSHPVPGDGRRDDLRGAQRPDPRPAPWPGPATPTTCSRPGCMRRKRFDFRLQGRDARRSSRRTQPLRRLGEAVRRRDRARHDPEEAVDGRRLRRHRHLGVDGRQGRRRSATICSSPIRSMRG